MIAPQTQASLDEADGGAKDYGKLPGGPSSRVDGGLRERLECDDRTLVVEE